jgi:hypothetical protein
VLVPGGLRIIESWQLCDLGRDCKWMGVLLTDLENLRCLRVPQMRIILLRTKNRINFKVIGFSLMATLISEVTNQSSRSPRYDHHNPIWREEWQKQCYWQAMIMLAIPREILLVPEQFKDMMKIVPQALKKKSNICGISCPVGTN